MLKYLVKITITVIFVQFIFGLVDGIATLSDKPELEGPNVCKDIESYTIEVTTTDSIAYQERTTQWCWNIKLKCSKYDIKFKTVNKTIPLEKQRFVKKCCEGYGKNQAKTACIPVCTNQCKNGICVAPEKCQCEHGWGGLSCDINCPPERWGRDCTKKCDCMNNSTCDSATGECLCSKGFTGKNCNSMCPPDKYGQNCEEQCRCANEGTCNHISGECVCQSGFTGPLCMERCPEGTHGVECKQECSCQNDGKCDSTTGQCTCPPGRTGSNCELKCERGFFGNNCSQTCECDPNNTAVCDSASGKCVCKPEWGGIRCETKCAIGFYGENCNEECRCGNNSSCDARTGLCVCAPGWMGYDCTTPCRSGYFGVGCKEKCLDIAYQNQSCNHITGQAVCKPGYIGIACEHPCPSGYYGPNCALKCACEHGGECSHETGQCQCPPGWTGANCNVSCPEGFYGPSCSQHCKCRNNSKCRKNDGHCICDAGWMGNRCEEICPEGYYGLHCMETCNCPSQQFACHVSYGCVCRQGFTGKNCDVAVISERIAERNIETSSTGVTFGIVVAVLLVAVIIVLLLYFKRRVQNLKTEIAHVQYIADPQSLPDRHHFDNPVYAFNPAANDNTHLLNNAIRNDLRNTKPSNLDRYKSSMIDDDSSCGSSRAGTYSINYNINEKNNNADLTNPNFYHSIDIANSEHVYDEIKQKEGYKEADLEYDHLDYSRPGTSIKQHYHRMNGDTVEPKDNKLKESNSKSNENRDDN